MIRLLYTIFVLLYPIRCTWVRIGSYITSVKQFSSTDTDGFISQFGNPNLPANYINCSAEGSYITLNTLSQSAIHQNSLSTSSYSMYFITYDLIFFNTWNNEDFVKYSIGSYQNDIIYNNIEKVSISKGFCNNQVAIIQTINYTINSTIISGYHKFEINSLTARVSIKNLIVSALQCHGTCRICFGSKYNQCSFCFSYGTLTSQNTCEYSCPSTAMYYVKNQGCKPTCHINQQKYVKGVCEPYPISTILGLYISSSKSTEQFRWQIIYDFEQLNTVLPENRQFDGFYIYGIFTNNQGIYRVLTLPSNQGTFMIAITVELVLFNIMPPLSSIQFLINDTYYGQIYSDDQGTLKTDKLFRFWTDTRSNTVFNGISYTNNQYNTLYFYADITNTFVIKMIGNYSNSNAGWGLRSLYVYSGYCPSNCLRCEEKFNCAQCQTGYLKSKWGTCSQCLGAYQQKINTTHCQEDDDETNYSKYIIKEFTGLELDIETYPEYTLLNAVGQNFLKGQGIYYSIWKSQFRIFGGPFIWAQAKFSRIINIEDPHHAITISFIVIFGPNFPEDGQFIFSLDGIIQMELTSSFSVEIPIRHKQLHNQNSISIELECKGINNEPIYSYCGFYQHYFTVHQCKPNCNSCSNESDCLDTNYVESVPICLNDQYFDQYQLKCQSCPTTCMTCTSFQNCLTCVETFSNPTQGCICASNQYLESNICNNCPQNCNQCINSLKCTECIQGLFRTLINDVCVCQDSYFELNNEQICQKCIQNCLKCSSLNQCDICLVGYQLNINGTCDQNPNTYFQHTLDTYLECPISSICNPCQGINLSCVCGDMIITGDEFCDDGNSIQFDGCYQCKFQCQPECTKCINGVCYECATSGWYLDVSSPTYYCKEVCWDGLIKGKEKCDDAISTTNCKDCQFYCKNDCLECNYENGKCIKCREGLIPENNYCKNICGDGIIVSAIDIPFTEECDDGNLIDFDGCSKTCLFQCQNTSICDDCKNTKCFHCINKYKLNINLHRCECDYSCQLCDLISGQGCLQCKPGFKLIDRECVTICGDSLITTFEQCDDGNMIFGDGCHQCQFSCESQCLICIMGNCLICAKGYQNFEGRCQELYSQSFPIVKINNEMYQNDLLQAFYYDYQYNNYLSRISLESLEIKSLQSIIQNEIVYFTYLFSNLINSPNQQIFFEAELSLTNYQRNQQNIMFTNCQMNDNKCKNYYDSFEQCNGNGFECLKNCPINCQICSQGSCIFCKTGYYLDIIGNSCTPICGDNLVTFEELCDDGNHLIYDGCSLCQFQCQEECIDCQYGQCKQCQENFYFDLLKGRCIDWNNCNEQNGLYIDEQKNQCYTKCGDSIKAESEQCDDGNEIQYDGCFQCQFSCDQYCVVCQQGGCEQCQIGYKKINQECILDCGDGLILGAEQCDDGNSLNNDGCTNCLIDQGYKCQTLDEKSFCFQCKSECTDCEFKNGQIVCLNCSKGYFISFGECLKCSDHCIECQHSPNNCTECMMENCGKCDNKLGYYNDFSLRKCYTICGDGIMAEMEECDDGNNFNQDGCNQKCQIEKGYECVLNTCNKKEEKQIAYGYSNSSTANCLFLKSEINFENFCTRIKIVIEYFNNTDFNYSLITAQINSTEQSEKNTQLHECQIQFDFFKTITEINLIHILIPTSQNQSRLLEEENIREIIVVPRKQVYYNQAQKAQAQAVVSTSNQLTFLLQLIGPLTILFGGVNFFWTILDILTWINNFYFLNVDYPLNVKLFFLKLQWDDIFNIPEFISLNQPTDLYYFEAPPKFNEKNINPLFINNIQVFSCLILLAILIYLVSLAIIKIFEKKFTHKNATRKGIVVFTICYVESNMQTQEQQQPKQPIHEKLQKLPSLIVLLIKQSYKYKLTFLSKLIAIINLLLLDIFMACILQLICEKKNDYFIVTFNNFLAIFSLILIFGMYQLYEFVSSKHYLLLNHFSFSRKYSSLYEGIDYENKIAKKYCYFNLIRKIAFIVSIVVLYEKPILQTTFCCLSCFINQAFLLYQNPFDSKIGLIQAAVPDFCIFCIILLSVLISIDDLTSFLSFHQKYNIGWMIICLIGISILIQLMFLLMEFYQNLLANCRGLKQLICK
ncbi:unnamed protein product [Paramecium primaurelia]|uniref:EGF-like domain-containing protein n=1 Tax=Paramecium primaurelia TaxID=5886 RepID=A0A8S1MVN4_PARPR|nr:unnamed protein product [Paramecium primaurelia]